MGCDIVFKINGNLRGELSEEGQLSNQIILKDSSLLSDAKLEGTSESLKKLLEVSLSNIARELIQGRYVNERNQLVQSIKGLKDTNSIARSANDLRSKGVVGNFKYHTLKFKYAGKVTFPNLQTPYDPDILLLDTFTTGGTDSTGIIFGTDVNGREVFVVKDDDAGVIRLANHLRVRDLILNQFEDNSELDKLIPEINTILKKDFTSQKELLLDFISNTSEYKDLLLEKGVFGILNEIVTELKNTKRFSYTIPLDRQFFHSLDKVRGTKYDYTLSKEKFVDLVKIHKPELLQELTQEQLIKDNILRELFNKFYPNFTEFAGKLVAINDKNLIIHTLPRTVENAYGFTYSRIRQLTSLEEVYRGFNIYKYIDNGITGYIYTQEALSPKTYISKLYNTLDEVKAIIDNDYEDNLTFSKNFETGFRMIPAYERVNTIFTHKWHEPGSIIKILDIELDRNTILDPSEEGLFTGEKTLADFYDEFRKQLTEGQFNDLKRVVDSIEAAGIFIYLVNEQTGLQSRRNLREGNTFEDILQQISYAKESGAYKYFFIQECSGPKGNFYIKMIPITSDVQMNEKYSRPEPIIGLMNEVIDTFNEKFKVGATLLTQDEISQQFPDIPAGTKAFIRGGNIYINGSLATSEDVIHEYTHLFLGALKAQNYDMYVRLLDKVMSSRQEMVESTKSRLRRIYPNLANSDLNEEVFVKLFADFLSGKRVDNMFSDVKSEVDSEMKNIFNLASEEDFNSLYRGRVKSIFQTFSKDIGKVGNGLDFSKGTVFRQAANWISDQMEKGDITERC